MTGPTPAGARSSSPRQEFIGQVTRALSAREGYASVLLGGAGEGKTELLHRLRRGVAGALPSAIVSLCAPHSAAPSSLLHDLLAELDAAECPSAQAWERLTALALRGPVLLLIDDVDQADPTSASALARIAEHLSGTAIGIIATARPSAGLHPELDRLPTRSLPELGESDITDMLGARAALVAPGVAAEVLSLGHNHPLAISELLPNLTDAQLTAVAPLPRRPPLGARTLRTVRRAWAHLPEPTHTWLLLLALGNPELAVSLRAARVLGLDPDDLTPAESAALVNISTTNQVSWPVPLVRAAVIQSATVVQRRRMCRALSEVTSTSAYPVEHARWRVQALASAPIDPAVVSAAITALARAGDLLDALELADQAAAHTQNVALRRRYQVMAAELCWIAGYPEHALRLLDQPHPEPTEPETRTSAFVLRLVSQGLRRSWRQPSINQAILASTGDGVELGSRTRALVTLVLAGWETTDPAALTRLADLLAATSRLPPPLAAAGPAIVTVVNGSSDPSPAQRLALRALAWWQYQDGPIHPKAWPPPLLPVFIGEEAEYADRFLELLESSYTRGARSTGALLLIKLATSQLGLGHWQHALRNAEEAQHLAAQLGLRWLRS